MDNTIDLFEDLANNPTNYPKELVLLIGSMEETYASKGLDYQDLASYVLRAEKLGFTFEYGLSAEPYNLQRLV